MKRCAVPILVSFLALFPAGSGLHAEAAGGGPTPHGLAMRAPAYEELAARIEKLQKSLEIFPGDMELRKRLATAYGEMGRVQLDLRQYDEAATSFDHARELEPENADFRLGSGIALYGGKHYDDALFELEQAKLYGGETVTVLFFLGKIHYDTGDLAGALELWTKGLTLDPSNASLQALVEKTGKEAAIEGRKEKNTSSRFTISYDVTTEMRLADEVRDVLDDAYIRIGSDFDHYPDARIPVILYTKQEFRSTVSGPDWSGGIYDGKIRLPIGGIRKVSPRLRAVLFHEYTHVVVRELTKGNCPTWLNEGLAMLEEKREFEPAALEAGKGEPLPLPVLEGSFLSLGKREAARAYRQSYVMVDHLVSLYGWHKVREILLNLGKGLKTEAAVTRAFSDYGLDYQGVMGELREQLVKELGDEGNKAQ